MSEDTIRIAVWNIQGPPPGKQFKETARKINAFQQEVSPHIAFYLEAPNGEASALPKIRNQNWEKTLYEPAEPNDPDKPQNPRGILVVQYRKKNSKIKIEPFPINTPKNDIPRTAVGISVFWDKNEFLRVLGVWTTPEKSGQKDFRERLSAIVADYRTNGFFSPENNIPCIVVGDTNVNLSAGSSEQNILKPESCADNLDSIKTICGNDLEIWNQGIESNTWRKESTKRGTKEKIIRWYRCDLMLISKGKAPVSARLGEREYRDEEGRMCGSDHRPIIFEVSLTN